MTGPAPRPAPAAQFPDPPPYVVRDDVARSSLERRAAAALTRGDVGTAAVLFDRQATDDPGNVRPAVGLVLARWKRDGATRSIAALDRIGTENPREPWVTLERGLARVVVSAPDATTVLKSALRAARNRSGQFDVARIADDVLHPTVAPGYPPMLVRAVDSSRPAEHQLIVSMDVAVLAGDRLRASQLAEQARTSQSQPTTALLVAREVAAFTKDRPLQTLAALANIRDSAPAGPDRAMASLHHAMVEIWVRGPERARPELERIARDSSNGRWARQADALVAALSKRA